jgi:hypothetical protein
MMMSIFVLTLKSRQKCLSLKTETHTNIPILMNGMYHSLIAMPMFENGGKIYFTI